MRGKGSTIVSLETVRLKVRELGVLKVRGEDIPWPWKNSGDDLLAPTLGSQGNGSDAAPR